MSGASWPHVICGIWISITTCHILPSLSPSYNSCHSPLYGTRKIHENNAPGNEKTTLVFISISEAWVKQLFHPLHSSKTTWADESGSTKTEADNIKSNQLCLHLIMWLSKQSCIVIHVTTVYITTPADVIQAHFLVASLLSMRLVS